MVDRFTLNCFASSDTEVTLFNSTLISILATMIIILLIIALFLVLIITLITNIYYKAGLKKWVDWFETLAIWIVLLLLKGMDFATYKTFEPLIKK